MSAEFLSALCEGRILASKCGECGSCSLPPRRRCPECGAETGYVELPHRGRIITYSEIHVSASRAELPYVVAIAELGEARLPGIVRNARYEDIAIGDEIEVIIEKRPSESPLSCWYFFRLTKQKR
ncbi:MAG: Zn-ribbon domain-containing OB-fold protein [Aigarchaeota archaeon]|nr:Zn-ribbon domain-containing OB-fold protein [Candidatus Pelearchaeum maunauluense]